MAVRKKLHKKVNKNMLNENADKPGEVSTKSNSSKKKILVRVKKNWKLLVPLSLLLLIVLLFVPILPTAVNKNTKLYPVYGLEEATKFEGPQNLVTTATADLGGQVQLAKTNRMVGLDENGYAVYKLPAYQVAGKNFSNYPEEGYGIAYTGDSSQSDVNFNKLVDFFRKNNFESTSIEEGGSTNLTDSTKFPLISSVSFKSDDIFCMVWRADISEITAGTQLVSIGCANKTSYEKAAESIVPFYDAYTKSKGKNSETLVLGVPYIFDGTNNHQRATLYQESTSDNASTTSFMGIYYRTSDKDNWTYFTKESAEGKLTVQCSSYNTSALKMAFSGFDCYNDQTKQPSTVQ